MYYISENQGYRMEENTVEEDFASLLVRWYLNIKAAQKGEANQETGSSNE